MTAPAVAAARTLWAFLLGTGLGLWYGFLRPLRPRHTSLADFLFLLGAGWVWLYLSFRICRGDPRLGYFAAAALGVPVADGTIGRLLSPIFRNLWTLVGKMWAIVWFPLKKLSNL